jgi:hypothetical protein
MIIAHRRSTASGSRGGRALITVPSAASAHARSE